MNHGLRFSSAYKTSMAVTANSPKALSEVKGGPLDTNRDCKARRRKRLRLAGGRLTNRSNALVVVQFVAMTHRCAMNVNALYLLTITGLTSMEPVVAEGMRAAMAIASSRSLASTRK
jgi:hypothetical protein